VVEEEPEAPEDPVDLVQAAAEADLEEAEVGMRRSLLRLKIPDSNASNEWIRRNFLPLRYSAALTARHGCASR
jgi:hypothetical protein